MRFISGIVLACTFILVTFFSCKKPDIDESTAKFMFIHASPNTPPIELFIDEKPILLDKLQFKNNTYYRKILTGLRQFRIQIENFTFMDSLMNFQEGQSLTMILYGQPWDLKLKVLEDNFSAVGEDYCHARFVQCIPDSDTIDITDMNTNEVYFSHLGHGEVAHFKTLNTGVYYLTMKKTATQIPFYSSDNDTLLSGKHYTMFSYGIMNGNTEEDSLGIRAVPHEDFE